MAASNINYAKFAGIKSVAGAIIFVILYVPFLGFFIMKAIRGRSRVLVVLTLFCAIRVSAFIIRAILARSESAGENLQLFIADEVLLGVGYFGLLYSAYALVLDREESLDTPPPQNIISRLTRNRHLFRLIMTGAVALGIAGSTMTSPNDINTGASLRKASIAIFLVLTVLQALQTCILARMELSVSSRYRHHEEPFGATYGIYILMAISVFLLIREIYSTATVGMLTRSTNEKVWYPLFALPELLAVICYAAPGLIPVPAPRVVDTELGGGNVRSATSL